MLLRNSFFNSTHCEIGNEIALYNHEKQGHRKRNQYTECHDDTQIDGVQLERLFIASGSVFCPSLLIKLSASRYSPQDRMNENAVTATIAGFGGGSRSTALQDAAAVDHGGFLQRLRDVGEVVA